MLKQIYKGLAIPRADGPPDKMNYRNSFAVQILYLELARTTLYSIFAQVTQSISRLLLAFQEPFIRNGGKKTFKIGLVAEMQRL